MPIPPVGVGVLVLSGTEAALSALSPGANNRRYLPELLAQGVEPHHIQEIWLAIPTEPNRFVDITAPGSENRRLFMPR